MSLFVRNIAQPDFLTMRMYQLWLSCSPRFRPGLSWAVNIIISLHNADLTLGNLHLRLGTIAKRLWCQIYPVTSFSFNITYQGPDDCTILPRRNDILFNKADSSVVSLATTLVLSDIYG